jgi:hypothetical protein
MTYKEWLWEGWVDDCLNLLGKTKKEKKQIKKKLNISEPRTKNITREKA